MSNPEPKVSVTYSPDGESVRVLIEEYVPVHSQMIDPPWWRERGFRTMEEARAWVESEESGFIVMKTVNEMEESS